MAVFLSLDCELLWGVSDVATETYIGNNVKNADASLRKIILQSIKCEVSEKLHLAFVVNALRNKNQSELWCYSRDTIGLVTNSGCPLGLHSISHKLYSKMTEQEYKLELSEINSFLLNNAKFSKFFVFPKNQIHDSGSKDIFKTFENVRVNSDSWLYKSIGQNYGPVKRILRYLDSFFPIYEFFCSKNPEVDEANAMVGTHFFRANLRGFFLDWHFRRLKLGYFLMSRKQKDMHIWSHPHNFNGNEEAARLFVELGRLK